MTCCGSRDGRLFTVSFTGSRNIILQVLEQLAFDYRNNAPTFRSKVESSLTDSTPLKVLSRNSGDSYLIAAGPCLGSEAEEGYTQWHTFQKACYSLHWAVTTDYANAERLCTEHHADASVVVPTSAEENAFVTRLQSGCQGWLGAGAMLTAMEDGRKHGKKSLSYSNWTAPMRESYGRPCAQLRADGGWVQHVCDRDDVSSQQSMYTAGKSGYVMDTFGTSQGVNCFVCKKLKRQSDTKAVTLSATSLSPFDSWQLFILADGNIKNEFKVRLRHEFSGMFLACSPDMGGLHVVAEDDTGGATFLALINEEDGSFTLRQRNHVVVLVDGKLRCMDVSEERGRKNHSQKTYPDPAILKPMCLLRVLASRFLRLSVFSLSSDLKHRGHQECSIAVADTSATSDSFRCKLLSLSGDALTGARAELWLEQQALLISDYRRWLRPRVPLPFGLMQCINEHPQQSAICTTAYGQGLTVARAITLDWNTIAFDTITVRSNVEAVLEIAPRYRTLNGLGGNRQALNEPRLVWAATKEWFNDLTAVFNNFNEIAYVYAYVETRNWQTTILALPQTTHTVQFWLETVMLSYRWRALFQARGSFRVRYFDKVIGSKYDVGDLSNYDDIFFYIFGRYDFPAEASLIATVDHVDEESWPVILPGADFAEQDWN